MVLELFSNLFWRDEPIQLRHDSLRSEKGDRAIGHLAMAPFSITGSLRGIYINYAL
jgi:hypothetical protein